MQRPRPAALFRAEAGLCRRLAEPLDEVFHDVSAKREQTSEEARLSVCLVNPTFLRSDGGPGGRHDWLTCTRHPKTCVLARTDLSHAADGTGPLDMTGSRPFDRPTVIYSKGREWPGGLLERPRRAPREPHHEAKVDRCNRLVETDRELYVLMTRAFQWECHSSTRGFCVRSGRASLERNPSPKNRNSSPLAAFSNFPCFLAHFHEKTHKPAR